jgi:hypothetical protein
MSNTINVLLDALVSDIAPVDFETRTKAIDGKDVKQFQAGGSGKWYNPVEVESLTINNDTAIATRIADKGFTYRWIKAKLSKEQVELIGAIRFKNAMIRARLSALELKKRMENMSKNYTLNFDSETVETVCNAISNDINAGCNALETRPVGMKRSRKAGEPKPAPQFTV